MMAPILSFLEEETYNYFKTDSKKDSVFLEDFPVAKAEWNKPELHQLFEKILSVRSDVQKKLEELRANKTIGSSLEAAVSINAENETLTALQSAADLREILIVSDLKVVKAPYAVTAQKAAGEKCVRCWVYSTEISTAEKTLGVCPKCVEALS
jgi:isoleucyl-tRNA synthetase